MNNNCCKNYGILKYTTISKSATDITLDEVKNFLRLDTSDTSQDEFLQSLLDSAIDYVERQTRLTLTETVFEVSFKDTNLYCVELRKNPFVSLNSATVDGEVYDISNIEVDNTRYPYAFLDFDCLCVEDATINFTAGYSETPEGLKNLVLSIVSFFYSNRGDCWNAEVPMFITCMLNKYKIMSL